MKLSGIAFGKQKVGRTYDFDMQELSDRAPGERGVKQNLYSKNATTEDHGLLVPSV